jgi:putative membrane protein insertion efficiency factor
MPKRIDSLSLARARGQGRSAPETAMKRLFILIARGWQLGPSRILPPTCRYAPSCSQFAIEALEKHGAIKGGWLATKRLLRCHPWGGQGYDPVP